MRVFPLVQFLHCSLLFTAFCFGCDNAPQITEWEHTGLGTCTFSIARDDGTQNMEDDDGDVIFTNSHFKIECHEIFLGGESILMTVDVTGYDGPGKYTLDPEGTLGSATIVDGTTYGTTYSTHPSPQTGTNPDLDAELGCIVDLSKAPHPPSAGDKFSVQFDCNLRGYISLPDDTYYDYITIEDSKIAVTLK